MAATASMSVYLRFGDGAEHEIGTIDLDLAADSAAPNVARFLAALASAVKEHGAEQSRPTCRP